MANPVMNHVDRQARARRPYTFVVMALLIAITGRSSRSRRCRSTSFPTSTSRSSASSGSTTACRRRRWRAGSSRTSSAALTSNVVGIEHIESQSHQSVAVVRVYFHPTVEVDLALSQIVTQCQVQVRNMPPGTFPPQVLKYDAASVPILQLGLSSQTLTRAGDLRPRATTSSARRWPPCRARPCRIRSGARTARSWWTSNLDELYAKRLSPIDVSNALNLQNLIVPAGTAKFAGTEYPVRLNSSLPQHRRRSTTCRSRRSTAPPST